jgi:hypothetical protein
MTTFIKGNILDVHENAVEVLIFFNLVESLLAVRGVDNNMSVHGQPLS